MLANLALRLAAVEALCPTAALLGTPGATFPTLAGPRVADSQIVARDDTDPDTALPFIAVYVEDARGGPESETEAGIADYRRTTLVCELEVRVQHAGTTADDTYEDVPETDPAAEAMLDLMEAQVLRTLEYETGGELYRRIRQNLVEVESFPMRDATLGVRFARRTVRLTVDLPQDDWSQVDDDGLPYPLSLVNAALPAGSYGASLIAALAPKIAPASTPTPLAAIAFGFAYGARPTSLASAPVRGAVDTD